MQTFFLVQIFFVFVELFFILCYYYLFVKIHRAERKSKIHIPKQFHWIMNINILLMILGILVMLLLGVTVLWRE